MSSHRDQQHTEQQQPQPLILGNGVPLMACFTAANLHRPTTSPYEGYYGDPIGEDYPDNLNQQQQVVTDNIKEGYRFNIDPEKYEIENFSY